MVKGSLIQQGTLTPPFSFMWGAEPLGYSYSPLLL